MTDTEDLYKGKPKNKLTFFKKKTGIRKAWLIKNYQ